MGSDSPQLRRALFGYRPESVRQLLSGRESMFRFAQERAQAAESKVDELKAELRAAHEELVAQADAAETMHAAARSELREATQQLQERTERVAALDAMLGELRADLAVTRHAAEQHAEAQRELADVQTELASTRNELAARNETARTAEARILELQAELKAARTESVGQPAASEAGAIEETDDFSPMLEAAEQGVANIMERARRAFEEQAAQAELMRGSIRADIERFSSWQRNLDLLIRSVHQGIEAAREQILPTPDRIREAVNSMTDAIKVVSDSLERLADLPGPRWSSSERRPDDLGDTVLRLMEHRPDEHITIVPPSGSTPEDEAAPQAEGEGEDPRGSDRDAPWRSFRTHGR